METVVQAPDQNVETQPPATAGAAPRPACRKYGVTTERSEPEPNSNGLQHLLEELLDAAKTMSGGHALTAARDSPPPHG